MPDEKRELLSPEQLEPSCKLATKLLKELDQILLGRSELHRLVLTGILARGHILLEGLPGLGKTELVKTLGSIMGLDFNRVQFTPDLMPTDILGSHILQDNDGHKEMSFQAGPIFTNIMLADEINRASPKTQSALLEAMQEHRVTLMGTTRDLPLPFFVLASQNPIELEGTYPLPEAQVDRFLFKLNVSGVDADVMDRIISTRRRGTPPVPSFTLQEGELDKLFETMDSIYLPKVVSNYISRLVEATHNSAANATEDVQNYVHYGASPRAAIGIAEAARGSALIAGRPTVGFEDVRFVAHAVLNHRMILNYKARFDGVNIYSIIDNLLDAIGDTKDDIPEDVQIG